jgi:hypothetical protein
MGGLLEGGVGRIEQIVKYGSHRYYVTDGAETWAGHVDAFFNADELERVEP